MSVTVLRNSSIHPSFRCFSKKEKAGNSGQLTLFLLGGEMGIFRSDDRTDL